MHSLTNQIKLVVNTQYAFINYSLHVSNQYIDFISRGSILNNKGNLPYGPQTITSATKHTRNYKKLSRVPQDQLVHTLSNYNQTILVTEKLL